MMTYCICDSVGVTSESPDDVLGICVHNEDGKVVTHHTKHGANGEREKMDAES